MNSPETPVPRQASIQRPPDSFMGDRVVYRDVWRGRVRFFESIQSTLAGDNNCATRI
jgi:hypothetical protein